MTTLKELEQAEAAKRQRLWKRDRAQQEVDSARSSLRSIEARLAQPDASITALESIITLADDIPDGFTTLGSQLRPGGYSVRQSIRTDAANALRDSRAVRNALEESLPVAQQRLANAEQALARLTGSGGTLPELHGHGTGR
jgi:hypothetical protein